MTRKEQNDRRSTFSQRYGYQPIKTKIQLESMDADLKVSLWNALSKFYWGILIKSDFHRLYPYMRALADQIWENFFKWPLDEIPTFWGDVIDIISQEFKVFKWNEVYDFVEFMANYAPSDGKNSLRNQQFMTYCNYVLEKELSAYLFVGGRITPNTSEVELTEIEEALERSKPFQPVHLHLQTAE